MPRQGVVQTIVGLNPNTSYSFTWLYGGRTSGGPDILDVYVNGIQVATDTGSIGVWTFNWADITGVSSATIEFKSVDTSSSGGLPSYGNEVTNVSVSAVPEPAPWAMLLLGAGLGLAGYRRTKRSAGDFATV
jgi:hypothetical protein